MSSYHHEWVNISFIEGTYGHHPQRNSSKVNEIIIEMLIGLVDLGIDKIIEVINELYDYGETTDDLRC